MAKRRSGVVYSRETTSKESSRETTSKECRIPAFHSREADQRYLMPQVSFLSFLTIRYVFSLSPRQTGITASINANTNTERERERYSRTERASNF